jgi:hypothetical protein
MPASPPLVDRAQQRPAGHDTAGHQPDTGLATRQGNLPIAETPSPALPILQGSPTFENTGDVSVNVKSRRVIVKTIHGMIL